MDETPLMKIGGAETMLRLNFCQKLLTKINFLLYSSNKKPSTLFLIWHCPSPQLGGQLHFYVTSCIKKGGQCQFKNCVTKLADMPVFYMSK